MIRVGIDLGGSKIEIIAIDDKGEELFRQRVVTPQGDYDATIRAIACLVDEAEAVTGTLACVGVGTPGAISPASGLLRNSNSVCMNGKPVLDDLKRVLNRDVRISNDANCFALSEATDGAAAGESIVFGVIIGTGTGAGVVINGAVIDGPNSISGEWGHNSLPWPSDDEAPGRQCYCHKYGCIETWLSGPGLSQDHLLMFDKALSAEDIMLSAQSGDADAVTSLQRYDDRMARSLSQVINILDPDVIVFGGGLSNNRRLYDIVPGLLPRYVFSDTVQTKLVPPIYGDSSGVRGAAWLWNS